MSNLVTEYPIWLHNIQFRQNIQKILIGILKVLDWNLILAGFWFWFLV